MKDSEDFAALYQQSWRFDIASQALTQLDQMKWNAPQLLPFKQDVQRLHCYLSAEQQRCTDSIEEEPSPLNWENFAKVTLKCKLCSLTVGEQEKTLKCNYLHT